jgi:hypothetical protein
MTVKVLGVNVYKNDAFKGCALGGVSERFDELLVVCDAGWEDADGTEENLCVIIHRRINGRDVCHIEPVQGNDGGFSAGGSFGYTSDSRFSEMIGGQYGALSIHDRRE